MTEPREGSRRPTPEGGLRLPVRALPPSLLLSLLFLAPLAARAAQEAPQEASFPGLDPVRMEAFFEGMIRTHLREVDIAGATLAVVQRGEVVVARGFGYADVEARRPVEPDQTLFRIGSVNKLFTFVAVMQLVEAGLVDLEGEVNEYLDFRIPDTFPEPVRIRHLMQHTAGFEEDIRDLFTYDPDRIIPLRQWVEENQPARVLPPGLLSSYSNYGTALLGRVVERVSGMDWDDYLEARILGPLSMTRTSGRQPLPEALEPDMSVGYSPAPGDFEPQPFELTVGAAPAGSMSSTAADMANFMLAILGEGALGEARILEPETVREMIAPQFTHDPRIPGYGLGFYEMNSHGVRIVGHGGNTGWFHSLLALFPGHDLGFFVSYNTSTGAEVSFGPVLQTFLDGFFPAPLPEPMVSDAATLGALAGPYRFLRYSRTTFQKPMAMGLSVTVREDDGALTVRTPFGTLRMVEVEPLLFQEERGSTRMAFRLDDEGKPTHAFLSLTPMMGMERTPWHGAPSVHLPILAGGVLLFLILLPGSLVGAFRRRRGAGGEDSDTASGALTAARWSLALAATAFLGFLAVAAVLFARLGFWGFVTTPMTGFAVALALPVVGALAVAVAAVSVLRLWRGSEGSLWLRLRFTGAVSVALLFVWSLHYWNLLGWRM
jgi:CubicO group peptidase (beta-lactamase class C family)